MASRTFQILGYDIYLGSKMLPNIKGQSVPVQAYIKCDGKSGEQFDIFFINQKRPLQQDDSDNYPNITRIDNNTWGLMFVPTEQYAWYVDLLRNEDPVWVTLDDQAFLNRVYCAGEPVGEGELGSLAG